MSENILVAVDPYDKDSWPMVHKALRPYLVTATQIHLVHVVPKADALGPLSQFVPKGFENQHREEAKELLAKMKGELGTFNGPITLHQHSGHVHVEVLDLSVKLSADLVVVGAYSEEQMDYLLGPKAARIARHAKCSVLIARP